MFINETKPNTAIYQLDFWAAALLVYWCNIYFFSHNTHFIVYIFNMIAYVATACVSICGYERIRSNHIILMFAAIMIFLVSLLLPAGSEFLPEYIFPFLVAGIIGILMVGIIHEPKFILFWWFVFSLVLSCLALKSYLGASQAYEYYMTTAYTIFYLFALLALLVVNKPEWYYFTGIAACSLAIVMIGTRGAIVAMLLTFLTIILFYKSINYKRIVLTIVLLGLISFVMYYLIFTSEGLNLLKAFLDKYGIQSRMVWLFEENRITLSTERLSIYRALLDGVLQSPLFGYGLGGDTYIVTKALGTTYYAHDFMLELIIDFGLLGVLLLVNLFLLFKKSAMSCKDADWKLVGYLFFICCFFPKIFSFTFLHPMTLPTVAILMQIKANNVEL